MQTVPATPINQSTLALHENFNLINVHQAVAAVKSCGLDFPAERERSKRNIPEHLQLQPPVSSPPLTYLSGGPTAAVHVNDTVLLQQVFLLCRSRRSSYLACGCFGPGVCAYSDTRL